ncbi:MAG TPA: hypothetical protein VKZ78_07285 [Sphingobacteriaceae bacterium]|nr:hypothetical protein [Sphingobacteriaceae bacterium]
MKSKRLLAIFAIAALLLSIPLIAMQFTAQVDWKIFDFAVMGVLLFGAGLLCEFTLRKVKSTRNRIIICGAILFLFFMVWAELAVGIFGTPYAGS